MFANSFPLSAQNLTEGNPKLQIQSLCSAFKIVGASLSVKTDPLMNLVQLSTSQRTGTFPKNLRSRVTIWLNSVLFGRVDFGLEKVFLNFLQILQSVTTLVTVFLKSASRRSAHLNAHMRFSALLWFVTSCIFLIVLYDTSFSFFSS